MAAPAGKRDPYFAKLIGKALYCLEMIKQNPEPLRIDGPVRVRCDPLALDCLPDGALGTPSRTCVCSNRYAY
jgi:hypothetical protein